MYRAVTPDYDPRFMDESLEVCPDYGAGAAGADVRWDPRPATMTLRRDPGVAPGEYPADDVALPIVWERGRGLLALA